MIVTIGPHAFDDVFYDLDGDVLYLSKGAPRVLPGDALTASPEGHHLGYDDHELVRITLVSPRRLLDRDGRLFVSDDDGQPLGDLAGFDPTA